MTSINLKLFITEKIDDIYSYCQLGPIKLVIDTRTGYFNATGLCGTKNLDKWRQSDDGKVIISIVSSQNNISNDELFIDHFVDDLIYQPNGLGNNLRGTYVHPKLATSIATWCNPDFGLVVDDIVVGYYTDKILEEQAALLAEKDAIIEQSQEKIERRDRRIKRRQDKIDVLLNDVAELKRDNRKHEKDMAFLIDMCKRQGIKLDDQTNLIVEQTTKIDNMSDTLELVANERVPRGKRADDNTLCVARKNVPVIDRNKDYYEYIVFRALKKNINSLIKNKTKAYPNMTIICKIDYTPNAVHLWKQYLTKHGDNIDYMNCEFNRKPGYHERKFIRHLNGVHESRLDY